MPILEQIFQVPHAFNIFGWPVDPVQLGIPDYNDVVKAPMDLGTVKRRLETGHYRDLHNFVQDVHLCFDNAMLYNPRNSDVHTLAKNLKREFDNHYKQAISLSEKAIELNRTNENACLVCGETCLKFEPPVYYCNGRCGGQRIRRNAFYYTNSNNTYHWCSSCFTDLRNDQPIKLPDSTLFKVLYIYVYIYIYIYIYIYTDLRNDQPIEIPDSTLFKVYIYIFIFTNVFYFYTFNIYIHVYIYI
jgi:hypothetical protein